MKMQKDCRSGVHPTSSFSWATHENEKRLALVRLLHFRCHAGCRPVFSRYLQSAKFTISFCSENLWSARLRLFLPYWRLRYISIIDITDPMVPENYLMGRVDDSEFTEMIPQFEPLIESSNTFVKFGLSTFKTDGSGVILHETKCGSSLPDKQTNQQGAEEQKAQQEDSPPQEMNGFETKIGASLAVHSCFVHKAMEQQPTQGDIFEDMYCIPSWMSSIAANTRSISKDRIYDTDRNGVLKRGTFTTLTDENSSATFSNDHPKVFPFEAAFLPDKSTAPSLTADSIVDSLLERKHPQGLLQSCPLATIATVENVIDAWKILLPGVTIPVDYSSLVYNDSSDAASPNDVSLFAQPALLFAELLCQMQMYYNGLSQRQDWLLLHSRLLEGAKKKGMWHKATTFKSDSDLILTTYWLFMRVITLREAPLEGYGRIATTFYALSKKFPSQWNAVVPDITERGKKLLHEPIGLTVYGSDVDQISKAICPLQLMSRRFQNDSAQAKGTINNFTDFLDNWIRTQSDNDKAESTYKPDWKRLDPENVGIRVVNRFFDDYFMPENGSAVNPFLEVMKETLYKPERATAITKLRVLKHGYVNDNLYRKHLAMIITVLAKSFLFMEKGDDGQRKWLDSPSLKAFRELIDRDGRPKILMGDDWGQIENTHIMTSNEGYHYSRSATRRSFVSNFVGHL
jgi:hypothetical protein